MTIYDVKNLNACSMRMQYGRKLLEDWMLYVSKERGFYMSTALEKHIENYLEILNDLAKKLNYFTTKEDFHSNILKYDPNLQFYLTTPKGGKSVSNNSLSEVIELYSTMPDTPSNRNFLEYVNDVIMYNSLKSKVENLQKYLPLLNEDRFLFCSFERKVTLRISTVNKSIDTIPKDIAADILNLTEIGFATYNYDYKAQEVKMCAFALEIERVWPDFLESVAAANGDVYLAYHEKICGMSGKPSELTEQQRAELKTAVNALHYGTDRAVYKNTYVNIAELIKFINTYKHSSSLYKSLELDCVRLQRSKTVEVISLLGTVVFADFTGYKIANGSGPGHLLNTIMQTTGVDLLNHVFIQLEALKSKYNVPKNSDIFAIHSTLHDGFCLVIDKRAYNEGAADVIAEEFKEMCSCKFVKATESLVFDLKMVKALA